MTSIKRKASKVILTLLILQIIFAIVNVSQAASWFSNNVINPAEDFYNKGKNAAAKGEIATTQSDGNVIAIGTPDNLDLEEIINDIYNILFPIGVAATVIVGGVLGIKFMLASVEDKAKIKESMIPYVAGCIVIYGAFGIWKLAIIIFSSI